MDIDITLCPVLAFSFYVVPCGILKVLYELPNIPTCNVLNRIQVEWKLQTHYPLYNDSPLIKTSKLIFEHLKRCSNKEAYLS